jgi:hypothetical protein
MPGKPRPISAVMLTTAAPIPGGAATKNVLYAAREHKNVPFKLVSTTADQPVVRVARINPPRARQLLLPPTILLVSLINPASSLGVMARLQRTVGRDGFRAAGKLAATVVDEKVQAAKLPPDFVHDVLHLHGVAVVVYVSRAGRRARAQR